MKKLMTVFAIIALVAFAAPALAAANPFMDVPAGHWAYDAVAQLASRGIASGYQDGSYKGAQPTTRYEMASMVARMLAAIDMEKAAQRDVDLLKRLVLEFKDELDALGVKVSDLDKRVALLENGVGGWKVRGVFRFDAKFGSSDSGDYLYTEGKETQFTKERFRLFLTKSIDENTSFYAEYRTGGGNTKGMGDTRNGFWADLYVDTKLPWDIGFRVGRFCVDFEDDYGLYIDNDALFYSGRIDGFRLSKNIGILDATAVIGRNAGYEDYDDDSDYMTYILNLHMSPNERFFIGALGYWMAEDSDSSTAYGDINTYGVYAGYNFTPAIGVKGAYYYQDMDMMDDHTDAWKVILDIKQEALKFTSLWLEYSREDNSFYGIPDRYAIGGGNYAYVGENRPFNDETADYIFAMAKQQWTNKFSSFVRYAHADFNTTGVDDASEWGLGFGYQYTPAVYFELAYDQVDYGDNNFGGMNGKESMVRFRTTVNF